MPNSTDDDDNFFHEKMQGVTRLKTKKVLLKKKPLLPRRIKQPLRQSLTEEFPFTDHIQETVTANTTLSFARPGLQHKVLRALRLGEIRQTQALDLHGSNLEQARSLLSQFLAHCVETGERCVRIIHGKGKLKTDHPPILKNQINNWLQQYPDVLAFHSATPSDGGSGAVYVLLKRART